MNDTYERCYRCKGWVDTRYRHTRGTTYTGEQVVLHTDHCAEFSAHLLQSTELKNHSKRGEVWK